MMQAAELAVLDWIQAHLRCDFLDTVIPWISRICDHGEIWILLAAVLLIPPLEPLFQVAELSAGLVGCIVGLAFGSMVVIQILKAIRSMGRK